MCHRTGCTCIGTPLGLDSFPPPPPHISPVAPTCVGFHLHIVMSGQAIRFKSQAMSSTLKTMANSAKMEGTAWQPRMPRLSPFPSLMLGTNGWKPSLTVLTRAIILTPLWCQFLIKGVVVVILNCLERFWCWVWSLGRCVEVLWYPTMFSLHVLRSVCCRLFLLFNIMIHNSLTYLRKNIKIIYNAGSLIILYMYNGLWTTHSKHYAFY
jgi:hypothetical protein